MGNNGGDYFEKALPIPMNANRDEAATQKNS